MLSTTTTEHDSSTQTGALLSAAAALGPLVSAHREALARGPDLPAPIAQALEQAGLTRLWLPRGVGGAELPLPDYLRVMEAIARHDGAVGWCASIACTGTRAAGLLPPTTAHELFAHGGFASGSLNPTGTAVRDGAGWRVSGSWSWGSFIRHSSMTLAMCIEHADGVRCSTPHGTPMLRAVLVPTREVRILPTWNSGGLRATGSHDFELENVLVPAARTIALTDFITLPQAAGPLYRLPFITTFALGITAVPLGIARASIDALLALAGSKKPAGMAVPLRELPGVQADVARAETLLRAARAFLFEAVDDFWGAALAGATPTLAQRALVRMACCHVAQTGKQVVDLMYSAAGGTATDERAPFSAQMRDVQVAAQHIAFASRNMETAGKILLGMDPGTTRF